MQNSEPTIYVALSGGVDSSVVLRLLQQKYKNIQGISHIVWPESLCCSTACLDRCQEECQRMALPYESIELVEDFSKSVIKHFIDAYANGLTPNPCVLCNQFIRFDLMIKRSQDHPENYKLATGHYARIEEKNGRYFLKKGLDHTKDQSYMLYRLSQEQLSRALFPLGEMKKSEVKKLAEQWKLKSAKVAESQDACFVSGDYRKFYKDFTGTEPKPGNFVDQTGKILGPHQGVPFYARGQRKGLGLSGGPWFVLQIDPKTNDIVLGSREALSVKKFTIKDCVWHYPPAESYTGTVQVRYHEPEIKCFAKKIDADLWEIELSQASEHVSPGQSAVLYDSEYVIGGGIIADTVI